MKYILQGLNCVHCAGKIEQQIRQIPELEDVKINLATMSLRLEPAYKELVQQIVDGVEWGTPAQVIINLARNQACDLIVMGSRGLSKMSGLFLGSVSDRVAKVAPCPVMLIKE
jgi:nucleotide-binding universal stress UspA family protein